MTIPSLRVEQHAQILSFAILGYGVATILEVSASFFQLRKVSSAVGTQLDIESLYWPKMLGGFLILILCLGAFVVTRNREESPRGWGLILAVLIFGYFPLGTLLSVYILIYLFAIDDGNYETEAVNAVHLNG